MGLKGVSKYNYSIKLYCIACNIEIMATEERMRTFAKRGYIFCSSACSSNSLLTRNKTKQTCLNKYGVENALQNLDVQENKKITCKEKYGVEFPSQISESVEKGKRTCLEKYGVETPLLYREFLEKKEKTCRERFGVINPLQNSVVMSKKENTCLSRYGVEHTSQDPEIFNRNRINCFNYKKVRIEGIDFNCQGYEKQALYYLIKVSMLEPSKILDQSKHRITIKYILNNKNRVYHPDLYLPDENKLIEVKSSYTMCGTGEMWENLKLKRQACLNSGYEFQLMVMTKDGKKLSISNDVFKLSQEKVHELVRVLERG